jgi:threonine dehydrogenase-like Zn-dependent dehydrogenase
MKAAVYHGPRNITVESVPAPEPGPADVVIKVDYCGICGSDVHSYKAGMYVNPGQVMGHEFVGRVAAAGRDVSGVREGDRVTGFAVGVCGECFWCRRGEFILCPKLFTDSTGYGRPGGFAEYVRIEDAALGQNLHLIPDGVEDRAAATTEPVSVAVGAVAAAGIGEGDSVVVLGAGMIGNACVQVARAMGAGRIGVVEVSPVRLEAARRHGADEMFDAREGDALTWAKDVFGTGPYHFYEGAMVDVVIEAAGVDATISQSFEMVRSGGTIVFVGLPESATPIDITKIVHKQPRIVGSLGGDFAASLDLLAAGRVTTGDLVPHTFPLDAAPEAFETQLRSGETVKVMVEM